MDVLLTATRISWSPILTLVVNTILNLSSQTWTSGFLSNFSISIFLKEAKAFFFSKVDSSVLAFILISHGLSQLRLWYFSLTSDSLQNCAFTFPLQSILSQARSLKYMILKVLHYQKFTLYKNMWTVKLNDNWAAYGIYFKGWKFIKELNMIQCISIILKIPSPQIWLVYIYYAGKIVFCSLT